jgi:hypothetical protein
MRRLGMVMRKYPSMFEIDFGQAVQALAAKVNQGHKSIPWAYKDGFQAYKDGKPLRQAMTDKYYPDTRELFRYGWLTAMFIDLNNRDEIVMARREDVLPD